MKIKTVFVLLLIAAIKIYAQHTVYGTISDGITGEALENVTVYVSDIHTSAISDADGNYLITDLPDGYLKFQFTLLGYKSSQYIIKIGRLDTALNTVLYPGDITTDEITVNEKGFERSYQSSKIKAKELMRYGVMNISEAVSKIPGVWQLSTGSGISKPVIRGLYGNRIGIMINGIRFDNQQWQDEHGLVMSSDGIDNIEVIKGPKSLLFGPEAIGGVVSITDEHPAPEGREIADLNLKFFTNTLGILGDIGLKGAMKNFNWLIRFGGETHADYLDGSEDRIPQTRFGGYTVKAATGYNKGIWAAKLNYSYTNYTYGILEGREFEKEITRTETRFDRSFNGPHHQLKVHNIVFQNILIRERSKFRINAGYIYNRRQEREGNDERFLPDSLQLGSLDMILNTLSLEGSWVYSAGKNSELTAGTQAFIQYNKNSGERWLIPDADVSSIALTSLFEYRKDRLGFECGARFDIFRVITKEFGKSDSSNYFPAISPVFRSLNGSAGITFKPADGLLLKANISTGFRAPNLAELTSNGLHEGIFQYELGNTEFKSEQSIEADAGLIFENRYFYADVSLYENRINNYIYLGQTNDTIMGYPVFRYFQNDARLRGMEAEIIIKPFKWLSLRSTYSSVLGKRNDGENIPLIPADKLTASLHFELNSWKFFSSPYFEVSTYTALAKTRLGENEKGTDPYTLLNAGIGCDLKFESQLINITISCTNLLNKVYFDFMSRIKLLSAEYNGKKFTANNMGRNIVLAVKIPFNLSYNN